MNENKNPNFFNPDSKKAEPEVQLMLKDDTDTEAEPKKSLSKSPQKKPHNFYNQDDRNQAEATPDFQDSNENGSEEAEKPVHFSKEKPSEKAGKKPQAVMKFSLNDDNEEDEESHPVSKQSPSKPKKHKFTKGFNDNKEMGDTDEIDNYDMFQKVEETPEEQEVTGDYVEPTFVVKEAPRGSQQRKYKAWERTDYKSKFDLTTFNDIL